MVRVAPMGNDSNGPGGRRPVTGGLMNRYTSCLAFALALLSSLAATAVSQEPSDGKERLTFEREALRIPHRKFVLDNGLTLLVHQDHSVPIVAVNVWYHVGSRDERRGKTGFAHLF